MFPYGQTVTRLRRGTVVDPYSGQPTLADWDAADEVEIPGCAVAPVSATEAPTVDRDKLTTLRTLYGPFGVDIKAEDRIRTADGDLWNVIGDPEPWQHPMTGWEPGTVTHLEKWEVRR